MWLLAVFSFGVIISAAQELKWHENHKAEIQLVVQVWQLWQGWRVVYSI